MLPLHVERLQGARGRRAWDCLREIRSGRRPRPALRSPRPLPAPAVPPPWSASGVGREMLSVGFVEIGELRQVGQPDGHAHHVGQAGIGQRQRVLDAGDGRVGLFADVAAHDLAVGIHRDLARQEQEAAGAGGARERQRQGAGITGDGGHGDFRKTGGMKEDQRRRPGRMARASTPCARSASGTGWRSTSAAASSEAAAAVWMP